MEESSKTLGIPFFQYKVFTPSVTWNSDQYHLYLGLIKFLDSRTYFMYNVLYPFSTVLEISNVLRFIAKVNTKKLFY